ncbi:hypothetical protein RRG08_025123 [Elysia crispata]|uniref:C-type lectin domain-containing protein n=1 Tax=Elysia crispata TaxID=231223 RepID=A0AAE1D710_9GAST|nr:hypothetical protein RRG08_025123 [Elysia crispata]
MLTYLCVTSKASCPPGWHTSKTSRSCIKLFLSKKSWDDARKACQAQGADLLINYNKEKENLIYEERDTLVGEACWIGLNDRNHEGDFTWLDDRQEITNVPWYPGEPNNYRYREHCVIVNKKRNKEAFLFDRDCSKASFFICEFSLENACDKFTGSCISGCDEGYQGQRCDAQLCPPMWRASKTSRSCVKLFLSKKSWRDARKACQAHGADLLINYNQEKEKLIYEEKDTLSYITCWIGLNDRTQEGDFNWLDNRQKVTNVSWSVGEPDNYKDREDCVGVRNQPNSGVMFFDHDCSWQRYFICELITVCAENRYGGNCSKTCSENCGGPENACDNFTGICTSGCDKGYQGERCEAACNKQRFGANCSENCSKQCGGPNKDCNNVDGSCILGCIDGYEGEKCDIQCENKTFGVNCSETCSENCGGPNNTCNNVYGYCLSGCVNGYQGERCEDPCNIKTFGLNCSENCSKNCRGPNNDCNNVNGSCIFGCNDGYQGERCEDPCNIKMFGVNCSENCSKNCRGPNNACNNVNGSCIFGCNDGYQGERCESSSLLGQSKKRAETNDIALLLKYLIAVTGLTFAACLLMSTAYNAGGEEAGSEFMTNEEETAGNQLRIHLGDIPDYSEVKPNIDNRFKQEWISTKEQQTAPLLELVLASLKGNEQKQEEP